MALAPRPLAPVPLAPTGQGPGAIFMAPGRAHTPNLNTHSPGQAQTLSLWGHLPTLWDAPIRIQAHIILVGTPAYAGWPHSRQKGGTT